MNTSISEWIHLPHGPRIQAKAISFIASKMDIYDAFQETIREVGDEISLANILADCKSTCVPDVSVSTLRRWWNVYEQWGEIPYNVKIIKKQMRKRYGVMSKTTKVTESELLQLKCIVDTNPNLYLDEIALMFLIQSGKFLHYTTIQRYITTHFNYTLQTIMASAKQQCKEEQQAFLSSLKLLLQNDPDRLITIDETHKDRNASRRRRGWAVRNAGGATIKEWYRNVVRYTMIAAADINGFIPAACHTVLCDELSDEGAAGTVDAEYFLYWVKEYLCPVLGRYEFGEPRSVVFMDNAGTHMSEEVQNAILGTGAVLIYAAPYSPFLNPIENYFFVYKNHLKTFEAQLQSNWQEVHKNALLKVDRDMGIKYFTRCNII